MIFHENDHQIDERTDAGIGVYHTPTGLNFSAAWIKQDYIREFYENFDRSDGENEGWIARAGIRKNWFDFGETLFAIDYARADDVLYSADRTKSTGIFFGQMIDSLSMELYTGYRYYSYDAGSNSGGSIVNYIHALNAGVRIGFDATFTPNFSE
ncbi:MAG: hypothetical protein ACR2PB_00440 [Desulfocapsaceae bacterium]